MFTINYSHTTPDQVVLSNDHLRDFKEVLEYALLKLSQTDNLNTAKSIYPNGFSILNKILGK